MATDFVSMFNEDNAKDRFIVLQNDSLAKYVLKTLSEQRLARALLYHRDLSAFIQLVLLFHRPGFVLRASLHLWK